MVHEYEFSAMGSTCSLLLYAQREDQADNAAQLAIEEVARIEERYSRYRQESELSRINQVARRGGWVTVDEETSALLDHAFTCNSHSNGLFDITSGILRQAWDFTKTALPEQATVAALLARVGMGLLDWQPPTLTFPPGGMELDLGGIAKEYAADRAVSVCREVNIQHVLVNLGGDVAVSGPRPDGSPWLVGSITNPGATATLLAQVALSHGGLATSGDYESYIEKDGRRYGHLLNPLTGWPVRGLASVSVVADRCLVAGTLATVAMLMGTAGIPWLAKLGIPHLWVTEDGERGAIKPPFHGPPPPHETPF